MNNLLKAPIVRKEYRISLDQDSPAPLWMKAKTRMIGFRRHELVQKHWRKVWRSMFED
jgi:hypothetical protein